MNCASRSVSWREPGCAGTCPTCCATHRGGVVRVHLPVLAAMLCRQTTPMYHGGVSGVNTTAQRGRMGSHIPTEAVDNSCVAGRAVVMCGRCSCYPRTSSPGVSGEYERVAR